jgi:hypothetical protein
MLIDRQRRAPGAPFAGIARVRALLGGYFPANGDSIPSDHGVALKSRFGEAYDEATFRYFLALERKRTERSRRPFLLVRLHVRTESAIRHDIDPVLAADLFSGLWQCVRETDFVGWFTEGRVAAAVLTQDSPNAGTDIARVVDKRLREVLEAVVPRHVAPHLRVRVCWIPRQPKAGS